MIPDLLSDLAMAFMAFALVLREVLKDIPDNPEVSHSANRLRRCIRKTADWSFIPILSITCLAYIVGIILRIRSGV